MLTVSNSELQAWARCPRKWLLTYYLQYQLADEPPTGSRNGGIRVHTALEGHYGYGLDPVAVLGILFAEAIEAHPEYEAELLAERELYSTMVEGYIEWLAETGKDADQVVVATEADVAVPCPGIDGVMLRARLDQVFRNGQGLHGFMDYKTGSFERHEILALDVQMRFYCLIQQLRAQLLRTQYLDSPPVTGGQVTTLRRVKRTSQSKPPYYQRDPFWYSPEMMTSTLIRTQKLVREILGARQSLDWTYSQDMTTAEWPQLLDVVQRSVCRTVPILTDCSWSCPLASGLCTAMDDGSDWGEILVGSGRYVQVDPYAHYSRDDISRVRAKLEAA